MVDGFWEETIVANGFLKDFYNSTIAIESMVLQSTIGDDGFSMVNEKMTMVNENYNLRQQQNFYEFKLPTDWNGPMLSRVSCTTPTCNGFLNL